MKSKRHIKKSRKRSIKRSRKTRSRKHKKDGLVDIAIPFNTRFAPKAFGWH